MTKNWIDGDQAMVECSDGEWRRATYRDYPGDSRGAEWVFSDGLIRRASDSIARLPTVVEGWSLGSGDLRVLPEESSTRDRKLIAIGFDAGWDAHAAFIAHMGGAA